MRRREDVPRAAAARGEQGERGAVMVLAVFGVVVAVMMAALAVDTGRLAATARDHQKIADLAALDTIRMLGEPGVTEVQLLARAQESALANGFDFTEPEHSLTLEVGTYDAVTQAFTTTPIAGASAVRVDIGAPVDFSFVGGDRTPARDAIAAHQGIAAFSLGSGLVSIDSSQSTILNGVLNGLFPGSSPFSISAATYQGLANSDVELHALQQELIDEGVSVGTFDQLMSTDIEAVDFLNASADVLDNQGKVAEANALRAIAATITGSFTFRFEDMIEVASGHDDTALATGFDVLKLVTGSAVVADGGSFIEVPNVGISVPGVADIDLGLSVIEPPVFYIGPAGGPAIETGQVELVPTIRLANLNVSIAGLVGARVSGVIPVEISAASATGQLVRVDCDPGQQQITVDVDAAPVTAGISSAALTVSSVVDLPLLPPVRLDIAAVELFALPQTGPIGAGVGIFDWPADFNIPTRVVNNSLDLGSLLTLGGSVELLGVLAIDASAVLGPVLNALEPVLTNLSSLVLNPVFEALGVNLGSADVEALDPPALDDPDVCKQPALVG